VSSSDSNWVAKAEAAARDVLARHAGDVDARARWPGEGVAALAKAGLLGLTVPAALGGAGAGPATFAAVTRTLAEQCASTAMIYLMHVCATQVVVQAPSFPLREDVLRRTAAGRHLATLAVSEPGSRSHFWAPVSQVAVEGDWHRLSADKSWVTSAGHADGYFVTTRSSRAAELTDSTIYYVPRDAPGLGVRGAFDGLGLRGNASAPMRLEGVTLPTSHRVSDDGAGFPLMMGAVLPWFQVGSAAVSLGIARAATAGIRRHLLASKLEHVGQPLASLMNLRARLAQMQLAADTHEAFLVDVCRRLGEGGPDLMLGLLEVKAAAAEMALAVTDLAMRAGGGASFSRHLSVERNFRDARAAAVMAPTTDVLYDFIGRILLDMPLL
jgi:alkylation response protein AidB-like acyl-CoA dehydrogenase